MVNRPRNGRSEHEDEALERSLVEGLRMILGKTATESFSLCVQLVPAVLGQVITHTHFGLHALICPNLDEVSRSSGRCEGWKKQAEEGVDE